MFFFCGKCANREQFKIRSCSFPKAGSVSGFVISCLARLGWHMLSISAQLGLVVELLGGLCCALSWSLRWCPQLVCVVVLSAGHCSRALIAHSLQLAGGRFLEC